MGRDISFVGHQDNGISGFMKAGEQGHDLGTGLGIEIPRGLVREQNRRIVHQSASDRYALALTPGQLIRAMAHSIG
jgi:hypothetical protein